MLPLKLLISIVVGDLEFKVSTTLMSWAMFYKLGFYKYFTVFYTHRLQMLLTSTNDSHSKAAAEASARGRGNATSIFRLPPPPP